MTSAPPAPAAEKRAWDGRSYGGRLGHAIFLLAIRISGRWLTYLLLAVVVPYYCLVARAAVRASRAYLERRLGPARWPRSLFRTYRHFFVFGQVLVDRFIFHAGGARSFEFTGEGWEHAEAALARGRGALFLSAHLGAWELASAARTRVFDRTALVPLNVVMHVPEGPGVPSFVEILEREGALKVIPLGGHVGVPFEVLRALERGEIVAMHGDRTVSAASATVPFLGAGAALPTGPWHIAGVTGAPVVPVFLVKTGWRRYHFRAFPFVDVALGARGGRDEVVREHVAAFARLLEGLLEEHPYEWFNFYDFWAASSASSARSAP